MHIFGAHSCSCSFFMSASSRCSFICFPCTIVVIFEGMSVAARVMCRYFSEWTLSCLRKGTGGIFLWDWSASPLIAWLSLSRSGSRSLHSHVCGHRNSTRVSDLLFRPRNVAPGSISAFFCEGKKRTVVGRVNSPRCYFLIDMEKHQLNDPKWLKDWSGLVSVRA